MVAVLVALFGSQHDTKHDAHERHEGPPYCSPVGKVATVLFHCCFAVLILAIQYGSNMQIGDPTIHVVMVHLAILLGLWGPQGGNFRHFWVPSPVHEQGGVALYLAIGLLEYIGCGMIEFRIAEKLVTGTGSLAAGQYPNDGTFQESGWVDMLWFCFVLLTTVGYGNTFTPTTPITRRFTIMWSLYGLFLFGAASNTIMNAIGVLRDAIRSVWSRMAGSLRPNHSVAPETTSTPAATSTSVVAMAAGKTSTDDSKGAKECSVTEEEYVFAPPAAYDIGKGLFYNFCAFLALNFVGSYIFYRLEDGMSFFDAFYHCIMTATTIGLGDIAPQTQAGRLYGIVHMILSVTLCGSIISTILGSLDRRAHELKKGEMLRRQLDEELIATLDRDGDGVDKAEFVVGMLELLGVLEKADYEPFIKQFEKLDATGDGRLRHDDLVALAKSNQAKAAALKAKRQTSFFEEKMDGHARSLCVPAFVLCFGFMWFTLHGFLMVPAGVCHVFTIGSIMASPPGARPYKRIALLSTISALLVLPAIVLIIAFLSDTKAYLNMDPWMKLVSFGELVRTRLNSSLLHAQPCDGSHARRRPIPTIQVDGKTVGRPELLEYMSHGDLQINSNAIVLILLYFCTHIYAVATDVMTVICCYKCSKGPTAAQK